MLPSTPALVRSPSRTRRRIFRIFRRHYATSGRPVHSPPDRLWSTRPARIRRKSSRAGRKIVLGPAAVRRRDCENRRRPPSLGQCLGPPRAGAVVRRAPRSVGKSFDVHVNPYIAVQQNCSGEMFPMRSPAPGARPTGPPDRHPRAAPAPHRAIRSSPVWNFICSPHRPWLGSADASRSHDFAAIADPEFEHQPPRRGEHPKTGRVQVGFFLQSGRPRQLIGGEEFGRLQRQRAAGRRRPCSRRPCLLRRRLDGSRDGRRRRRR